MAEQRTPPASQRQANSGTNRTDAPPPPPPGPDEAAKIRGERAQIDARRADGARTVPTIGPPIPRYDAREKVTGSAVYAGDVSLNGALYGYIVHSDVARGRITRFDAVEARGLPGVIRIYDHESMKGRIKPLRFSGAGGRSSTDLTPMIGPEIAHEGQIIGLVVAESYEAARDAARRVRVETREVRPSATFGDGGLRTRPLKEINKSHTDPSVGDFDAAFAAAPVKVDAEYLTPIQHHNAIELYSTTCIWEGDRLTVHEPSSGVSSLKHGLATQLGIDPGNVRVLSRYVGGSFGAKSLVTPRTAVAAVAARDLGRPVKLVLTREQGFTQSTHRAETRHRVRLGATPDGRLIAYGHEGWELTSRTDAYTVAGTSNTVHMYACPNVSTTVYSVEADRNTPGFMRAPPEVPYNFALELAMDEMAEKLGMDPVALRKLNDAQTSSVNGKRYTSRNLIACLDRGAAAFGWSRRSPQPRSMREGDWLIGYGVATNCYPTAMIATALRLTARPDGTATVETGAHEVGTGAYTVIGMAAAQELGLEVAKVRVMMGDSDLPPGPVAGGSNTTASVCNTIAVAAARMRERLDVAPGASITTGLKGGPVEERIDWFPPGAQPEAATARLHTGAVVFGGAMGGDKLRAAFGATFVEVRVNERTREIRCSRIVGAFAAGRIMNERTARSQLVGGMIWGIGSALHEGTEIDHRAAKYVNDNIAEYLIAVNADTPSVEVIMVPEEDRETNALGIKGIGELGNVGVNAAIAAAVYHATGMRIRDLPIRIENLLPT